jgi:hypothetical protein
MIKKTSLILAVTLILVSSIVLAGDKSLTFGNVVDSLNLSKKTALAVKTFWQEINGQEVSWSGKVVDVKGRRDGAQICVANDERSTYKGYNIVLETYDKEAAAKLDIGDSVRFTGVLSDYKGKKGNPIVIYLNSVQIK